MPRVEVLVRFTHSPNGTCRYLYHLGIEDCADFLTSLEPSVAVPVDKFTACVFHEFWSSRAKNGACGWSLDFVRADDVR